MGAAVAAYVDKVMAPRFARPEQVLATAECRALLDGLVGLGVLDGPVCAGLDASFKLWGQLPSARARRLSVAYLQSVGRVSAALALQLHQEALGHHLDRLAGLHDAQGSHALTSRPLALMVGHQGLGREAVVQHLMGRPLSADHAAVLADNWRWPGAHHPRLVQALADWQAVWLCTWQPDAGWRWHRMAREALVCAPPATGLGLDELCMTAVHARGDEASAQATLSGEVARQAWVDMQGAHALGLLAITQAGVQRAVAMAHDFAHMRQQGGSVIAEHAAVQHLLSQAHGSAVEAASALQNLTQADAPWPGLREAWRVRALHQVRLSQGASAALQVFGATGYMKDTGLERLLRQTHHLRLLGGSPAELGVCVAYWDTCGDTCGDTHAHRGGQP